MIETALLPSVHAALLALAATVSSGVGLVCGLIVGYKSGTIKRKMTDELQNFKMQLAEIDLFSQIVDEDDRRMMKIANGNKKYLEQWDRVNAELQRLEANQKLEFSEDEEMKAIFDILIIKASMAIPANGSLQGDILDDLTLVARAARIKYADAWLDTIWAEYQLGKFPRMK